MFWLPHSTGPKVHNVKSLSAVWSRNREENCCGCCCCCCCCCCCYPIQVFSKFHPKYHSFPYYKPLPKNMKVSFLLCNLLQILKQQDFLKWAIQKRQTIFLKPSRFNTVETSRSLGDFSCETTKPGRRPSFMPRAFT